MTIIHEWKADKENKIAIYYIYITGYYFLFTSIIAQQEIIDLWVISNHVKFYMIKPKIKEDKTAKFIKFHKLFQFFEYSDFCITTQ